MKKTILLSLLMLVSVALTGCYSCHSDKAKQEVVKVDDAKDASGVLAPLVVEHLTITDKEAIFLQYGGDYRWYETCILLADWLDSEDQEGLVAGVSNVFQVTYDKGGDSYDTYAIVYAHTPIASTIDTKHGFWVGDYPLNDAKITLTFQQAYEQVVKSNYVKPHSRQCVLRREVGPVPDVNPQYIFGNTHAQLYVDAVTGEVSSENPAFEGFDSPLKE